MSLTAKQHQLLKFITDFQTDSDGIAPSFDEMKAALGMKSKSQVHRILTCLQERGYIARLRQRARSITLLKTPEGMDILGVSAPIGGEPLKAAEFRATSDAITRLYAHGLLTIAEKNRVRRRFLKAHGVAA